MRDSSCYTGYPRLICEILPQDDIMLIEHYDYVNSHRRQLVPSSGKFRSIIIAQLDRHVRMLSRRLPLSAIRIDRLADNQRGFMTGIQGKTTRSRYV